MGFPRVADGDGDGHAQRPVATAKVSLARNIAEVTGTRTRP